MKWLCIKSFTANILIALILILSNSFYHKNWIFIPNMLYSDKVYRFLILDIGNDEHLKNIISLVCGVNSFGISQEILAMEVYISDYTRS